MVRLMQTGFFLVQCITLLLPMFGRKQLRTSSVSKSKISIDPCF